MQAQNNDSRRGKKFVCHRMEFDKYRIHKTWHYLLEMAGHFQYFICVSCEHMNFAAFFLGSKPKSHLQWPKTNAWQRTHTTPLTTDSILV